MATVCCNYRIGRKATTAPMQISRTRRIHIRYCSSKPSEETSETMQLAVHNGQKAMASARSTLKRKVPNHFQRVRSDKGRDESGRTVRASPWRAPETRGASASPRTPPRPLFGDRAMNGRRCEDSPTNPHAAHGHTITIHMRSHRPVRTARADPPQPILWRFYERVR